jgi:hypothetical protein
MEPISLVVDFVVGSIGFVALTYGRRQSRPPQLLVGIGMLALTLVPMPWVATAAVGALMVGLLVLMVKLGV